MGEELRVEQVKVWSVHVAKKVEETGPTVMHKPSGENHDPLCWVAEGRVARAGDWWITTKDDMDVTCKSCLEWMHA